MSKHVQRLVGAGLVVCVPIPGNRKEIELALTDDGKRVVDAHQQLHDEMDLGVHDFLQAYGNGDLQVVANVLRDLLAARKEGVRIARH